MIVNIFKSILKSPKTGWEVLENPSNTSKNVGLRIIILFSFIAGLLSFAGIIIHHNESASIALKYFGFTSLKWILSLYIASYAISKLSKGFKGNLSFDRTLVVVPACASFLVLFSSLTYLVSAAQVILYFLSAIGVVYLYYAFVGLSGVTKERVPGFLLISLLIFALIIFIMEMVLVIIFSIPVHL
ncbi:MAG: hypothetical protein RBR30_11195 [Tenuifilaceae bacterium]|nr:hypothetical protein [Tenuifilaceae bacterium]